MADEIELSSPLDSIKSYLNDFSHLVIDISFPVNELQKINERVLLDIIDSGSVLRVRGIL